MPVHKAASHSCQPAQGARAPALQLPTFCSVQVKDSGGRSVQLAEEGEWAAGATGAADTAVAAVLEAVLLLLMLELPPPLVLLPPLLLLLLLLLPLPPLLLDVLVLMLVVLVMELVLPALPPNCTGSHCCA